MPTPQKTTPKAHADQKSPRVSAVVNTHRKIVHAATFHTHTPKARAQIEKRGLDRGVTRYANATPGDVPSSGTLGSAG